MRSNPSAFEGGGGNGDDEEPPDERPVKIPHR